MPSPIENRVAKLLDLADRRGMVVERVLIEGQRIEIVYATARAVDDADLIDFRRPKP
jgi:hypothetical protein